MAYGFDLGAPAAVGGHLVTDYGRIVLARSDTCDSDHDMIFYKGKMTENLGEYRSKKGDSRRKSRLQKKVPDLGAASAE